MLIRNSVIIITTIVCLFFLFHKRIRQSSDWHATITPLASIIGSGFLVSAPLLLMTTGRWATLVMVIIVIIAYALGSCMRFNILHLEPLLDQERLNHQHIFHTEMFSNAVLGVAYIISVAFYLKLFSVFILKGFGFSSVILSNSLTTVILLLIGLTGKFRGLSLLESYEIYSVNTKLAIIVALIVGDFLRYTGRMKTHPCD